MLISIYKYYKLCYSLQVYTMSLPFLIELGEGHTAIDALAFGAEVTDRRGSLIELWNSKGILWHKFGANGQ